MKVKALKKMFTFYYVQKELSKYRQGAPVFQSTYKIRSLFFIYEWNVFLFLKSTEFFKIVISSENEGADIFKVSNILERH